jgi:hypothetical protein
VNSKKSKLDHDNPEIPVPKIYVDSLRLEKSTYSIIHFHIESDSSKKQLVYDSGEDVFNDTANYHSRLIYTKYGRTIFNIPTPPLTNIIYNESAGIIIGLSKIVISPYHVVIYDLNGKLLAKRSLGSLELIFTPNELYDLITKYPDLTKCINNSVVVKRNDSLIVEISSCLSNTLGRDKIRTLRKFSSSQFFPSMISPIHGGFYANYFNSFSDSDPLYDVIKIGSVPYLIILNSEDGGKVNIPLVSTFSIFR